MISFPQATELVASAIPEPRACRIPINDAVGHVLSVDIISDVDVSPFRNSAMDGFAVRTSSLTSCSPENPVSLPIDETVRAGDSGDANGSPDVAVKIMTGALVPEVYDAIVPVEDCVFDNQRVTFEKPVKSGANVRLPGEDIQSGQVLFKAGHRLRAFDIGVLASTGATSVAGYPKPRALIVNTGNELQPIGTPLGQGQIYDSNRYTVSALIHPYCQTVDILGPVIDDREALAEAIGHGKYDVVISTGGVSAGDRDYVPEVAESLGWQRVFHKASIKPGKPLYFAKQDRRLFFGLPGNPLSVAVTCAIFVVPTLRRMAGIRNVDMTPLSATLVPDRESPRRTLIWPGQVQQFDATMIATLSSKSSSASLTALSGSDGLIIQHSSATECESDRSVQFLPWQQILGT